MKEFLDENFLLKNDTAKVLYHSYAKNMPIFDFHNHLSAQEIYEDRCYENIARLWLGGDHYKWRAMRAFGIPEEQITGDMENDWEKFEAWAKTVQAAIGNPLYHWTHLELQRYFGIYQPLTPENAKEIWDNCNKKLQQKEYSVRDLLKMQNVKALCTTNDPMEDLIYHKKLKDEGFQIQVLPTFRPDRAVALEKGEFVPYIRELGEKVGYELNSIDHLLAALKDRLDFFENMGCLVSDHSLECNIYRNTDRDEADFIYQKKLDGRGITDVEYAKYRGFVLCSLGREYHRRGMVMQLHIGALRNNSSRMYRLTGADSGFDGMNDFHYAPEIGALLDSMDKTDELPKTVLYCLNPNDMEMLAVMAGNFQGGETKGKVQLGAAWWFNDHKAGMDKHLEDLANVGILPTFIGMLTDSRSFLSFPRHEYFRRILCQKLGSWVEDGEYPQDLAYLGKVVQDICYGNAAAYFGMPDE
ncbi:glucuronate isomerase [uncultured Robinsoniella sp.]|uniref:glucuronate isomerase n=1 Tax=uncultured Robinsoniella sp. TaxID=904190 RepID=UPI00374E53E7